MVVRKNAQSFILLYASLFSIENLTKIYREMDLGCQGKRRDIRVKRFRVQEKVNVVSNFKT